MTNANGAPVALATIGRAAVDSTAPMTLQAAVTDGDGRYWWPLPSGRWLITASAPGLRESTREVTVGTGEVSVLDLQLQ